MWCSAWGLLQTDVILPVKAYLWNVVHWRTDSTEIQMLCISFQDNVDLGELMFSLCYLPTAGRLTITMIKARNLKAMDITGASGGCWLNAAFPWRGGIVDYTHEVCHALFVCFVASRADTSLHPNWTCHMLPLSRSVCEGVADVWRPEAKEEEDVDQAEHFEPGVQWSHCVRCSSWEHRPDQPAHSCHGLWSVSKLAMGLQYVSFIYSTLTDSTFWSLLFVPQGWT